MASATAADPTARLAAHLPRLAGRVATQGHDGVLVVPGSLLCADLTGFTRLTERFTAQGRHGAEEVSAVLDATFSAVLGPALDAGGDVLCFGGDAATIAFDGDGHEARSCRAAGAMQQALAAAPKPAGAERVALRMTVGVATGELEAALVGTEQQALVVLGPVASRAVQLQHAGRPGQVLVADRAGATRVLRRTGGRAPVVVDATRAPAGRPLASLVPPALRDLVGGGAVGAGELRRTSTAFVVARAGSVPAVRAVAEAVEVACTQWGVCWLAADVGDASVSFVLTAGAPVASEHDEERMVGAVGAVLQGLGGAAASVRIGLERGVVFAGDVGHPERRAWTVIGDSVNVAARLAGAASPGQALVGPDLRAAVPHVFDDLAPVTLALKGRRRPVTVVSFDRPRRLRPPTASTTGPFVGRDTELGRLAAAWGAAGDGRGRAVELVADAGMGKSRLLLALRAVAGEAASTVVVADHYRTTTPFAASAKLLRDLAGIPEGTGPDRAGEALGRWVAAVAPQLEEWLPLVADAADARVPPTAAVGHLAPEWVPERRRDVVVALLGAARPGPWLLVVDDLHLVDEASRALLAAVGRGTVGRSWLVCTAVRPTGAAGADGPGIAGASGAEVLELGPLEPQAAAELVLAAAEPVAISDAVLARILDAADGNPLFLRELARHSVGVDPEVPDTIERLLAARIDTLAPVDRQLLRDLSVLGRSGSLEVAARWLGRAEVADPARWVPLQGLVAVEPGPAGADATIRFRSDLTRSIAYAGLSVRRRRALHGEVAAHLRAGLPGDVADADDETVGLLAAHLLEAGDPAAAWPVAVDAARRARARVALVDAAALYARALRLVPRLPNLGTRERAAVFEEQGEVAYDLGHFDVALDAYRSASRAYDDPIDRARICSRRVVVQQKRGALAQAATWATKGLRLLEGSTDERAGAVRAQLALDQAATRHFQGRNRESIAWAERAADGAGATEDQQLLASAHLHLEMAHSMLGDGQAAGHGEKAVALFEAIGDRRELANALINSGLTAYDEGRWADARSLYRRAAEVSASTGNVTQVAVTELNTAFLLAELGETDDAAALCASAARAFRASGNELSLGYVDWLTARLALWAGDTAAATEQLVAARRRFDGVGARQMVLDCDVTAIEVLLVAGEVAAARAEADRLVAEVDAFGPAELVPITVRRLRAHALASTGDAAGALASAQDAVERARDHGARTELALSLDAVAHAERALGRTPTPAVLAERDELLAGLGIRRTIFPLA